MHHLRRTLLLTGAGLGAAVTGGVLWRAADKGVFSAGRGPAYEAWSDWPPRRETGPLALVHAAILAASPHNTQPWLFAVRGDSIDLYVDRDRNIGSIDPLRREQWIGIGCALENLLLSAAALGWKSNAVLTPDSALPELAARIALSEDAPKASELFDAIPRRHTHRGRYVTSRALEPTLLTAMDNLVADLPNVAIRWFRTPEQIGRIGPQVVAATEAIIADREQSSDSAKWLRMDSDSVQEHRDGVTLEAAGLDPWLLAAVKMMPAMSPQQNDAAWLDATRKVHVGTAGAFGIVVARDAHAPAQRVLAGRFWQRLHLWATVRGLALQPLNQMPERSDRETTTGAQPRFTSVLKTLVDDSSWMAVMPFRLGYPEHPVLPSPRRSLQSVLIAPT
jgi:nitroreductase